MTVGDAPRRAEILDTAAELFATTGIRASLKDIADACGIMAGSLYHHFDSKEAILVELVQRYHADLDALAERAMSAPRGGNGVEGSPLDVVAAFGTAIAECAVRHRAALLLTFYEPPSTYGPELAALAGHTPAAIESAMAELLGRADDRGLLRAEVDRAVLADRLCQSMLHVGIGVFHRNRAATQVPGLKCRMLFEGLAATCPADAALERSPARAAADAVIAAWPPPLPVDEAGDRTARILGIARTEFGRRGYEATTIRDVTAAAGVSAKTVYRTVGSKEDLLAAILGTYVTSVTDGWDAVLGAPATPVEKLDALAWLAINLLDRFSEEHRIQSVSLQVAPPTSPDLGLSFPSQLGQMRALLAEADRAGEMRLTGPSADVRARCVFSLVWTPENIVRALGDHEALRFARETLLRGAAVRATDGP